MLPCVAVNVMPVGTFTPYQIGGGQYGHVRTFFYVFADNQFERNQLADIIARQNDKSIWLPNRGTIKESGIYPYDIDMNGSVVESPRQYPDIVADTDLQWRKVAFSNTTKETVETRSDWLYVSVVTTTFEIVLSEI
jgi:hypothetical protein